VASWFVSIQCDLGSGVLPKPRSAGFQPAARSTSAGILRFHDRHYHANHRRSPSFMARPARTFGDSLGAPQPLQAFVQRMHGSVVQRRRMHRAVTSHRNEVKTEVQRRRTNRSADIPVRSNVNSHAGISSSNAEAQQRRMVACLPHRACRAEVGRRRILEFAPSTPAPYPFRGIQNYRVSDKFKVLKRRRKIASVRTRSRSSPGVNDQKIRDSGAERGWE